jgi:hypothetical protein
MGEVRLSPNGDVLDEQENVLPLRIREFRIRNPSESDQTALKLIVLDGRGMYCEDGYLGELHSVDLEVTGEPDEDGFVTAQFPP